MTYLVLARKWRPERFSDVVGQEIIVKTLSQALKSGRIAHAFLLTGSRGVGKTTVARLLAKALSCETGIAPEPCGVCSNCREIAAGASMDVIEIDGASNTGVDDVRELRESLRYQPGKSRFKIFIIDEVHMLSTSAFNALLKTLEEPPPHVKFIFATTEAHKIPVTILSRCQRYDFRRMRIPVIVERLQDILKAENLSVDADGLYLIAENADGGMRDALSLLDQVISFSGDHATAQDVVDILGLIDRNMLVKATDALLEGNTQKALGVLEAAHAAGYDDKLLIDGVALELRHLCLASAVGSIAGLADLSDERIGAIDKKSKVYEPLDLQRVWAMAIATSDQMSGSEQPRLVLELGFVKIAGRPQLGSMSDVQKAIQRLEALGGRAAVPAVVETLPVNNWVAFVKAVGAEMPVVSHHLEHARYDGKGRLEFDQKLHFMRLQETLLLPGFQEICKKYLGLVPTVSLSESIHVAKESAAKREQESIEQKARSNPTIQKALSIFGGEIKAVRKV